MLGIIKFLRPSIINYATHFISNPHQGNPQLQALADGLSIIYDISQKIIFQEHNQVIILYNKIILQFANKTFIDIS